MARGKFQQTARKSTGHSAKRAQLASKKIYIKKEDGTNKRKQANPRRAPGVVALMDIRRFQKSTGKN